MTYEERRSGHDRRALVDQKLSRAEQAPVWLLVILVVVVSTFLAVVTVITVVHSQRGIAETLQEVQNQANETRGVVIQNRQQLSALLCETARSQSVSLAGIRALAETFGVKIATLPGETVAHCTAPGDDVFVGTDGNDDIHGTRRADFINGQGGNDTLQGRRGSDVIFGGSGNDYLWAGRGEDRLFAGDGNDHLMARADDRQVDMLDGGPGQDTCILRPGDRAMNCEKVYRIR